MGELARELRWKQTPAKESPELRSFSFEFTSPTRGSMPQSTYALQYTHHRQRGAHRFNRRFPSGAGVVLHTLAASVHFRKPPFALRERGNNNPPPTSPLNPTATLL